ncbi:hypothetical protein [Ancylobacter sp.]|uniref:hypothetical protein n=1 Tax=Ancylobacter sp. TaxID=1872567 RepID=UPI003BACD8DB
MHEAKPYGHLLLNGEPVGGDALARMTGTTVDEAQALMAELRQAGVFGLTRAGIVFSRRMTKDHAASQKGKKSIEKRWSQASDKPKENDEPNRVPIGEPNTQKPDAREERIDANASCPKPAKSRTSYPQDFEEFWKGYPTDSLMSKKGAAAQFARLSREDRAAAMESLPAFRRYCEQNTDYRPVHAERYLSQRRFDGFVQAARKMNAFEQKVVVKFDTPQWNAWDKYLRMTTGKGPQRSERLGGYYFDSEWPPSQQGALHS